jgi:predicted small metal-binding protein
MEQELFVVTCSPECGFMIQSHDKKEIIDTTKRHTRNVHNMKTSEKEIKSMIKRK